MSIAFLGPRGTYSESAALVHAGDRRELVPFPSIAACVEAVESGAVAEAVLPLENSIEGGVSATLDLLIHETDLKIFREIVVPIRHMLVAREHIPLESVRTVISHPQALGQCRRFLDRHLSHARQVASLSTAGAVQQVVEGDEPTAVAIGPRPAHELYGGVVLSEDIQDNAINLTRFVAVRFEDAEPTGDDKTSIGITADADEPGVLERIIRPIAEAGLNLTRLESRPTKGWLGTYVFLIDFEGHRAEQRVQDVLAEIERFSTMLKVFGSYPRFPIEELKEMVQAPAQA